MAATETCVSFEVGTYPYGPPSPDAVVLASGTVRALAAYAHAVTTGQTMRPEHTTAADLEETMQIAQARLTRAVLGSMRINAPPIKNRSAEQAGNDDLEATGASNDTAEAQQIHEELLAEYEAYTQKLPFGVTNEELLERALMYVAGAASEEWETREAQEVAASRGYTGMLAFVTSTIPDTPATIEVYA